jgi:hypothetical protein
VPVFGGGDPSSTPSSGKKSQPDKNLKKLLLTLLPCALLATVHAAGGTRLIDAGKLDGRTPPPSQPTPHDNPPVQQQ